MRGVGRLFGKFCVFLIFVSNSPPRVSLYAIHLFEKEFFLRILCFPRISLYETQFPHLLMLHQSALHSTLQIFDLIVSASFGNELVAHDTVGILLGFVVTLVEVIERERPSIRGFGHYN